MGTVGLVVNPMAGRDIRRLVARAALRSAQDKVQAGRRILAGACAVPGTQVVMMDDSEGLAQILAEETPVVRVLGEPSMPEFGQRTTAMVRALERAGADVVVVVGGDGTQRNAAEAAPRIPILPVSGGTNNVACWTGDDTVAGFAAALYANRRQDPAEVATRAKMLHVATATRQDLALVDVALVTTRYTGALAVWQGEAVEALVLAVADPTRPGLSNIGGMLGPVTSEEDRGMALWLGRDGHPLPAVLAPGLMERFFIREHRRLALGEAVTLTRDEGGTLALDGERTVVLGPGELATVTVARDGPWILSPERLLTSSV